MTRPDPDEYSLISWLESQALEAHNTAYDGDCEKCEYRMDCATIEPDQVCEKKGEEKAYTAVIAHIRNSHVNARPHVERRV